MAAADRSLTPRSRYAADPHSAAPQMPPRAAAGSSSSSAAFFPSSPVQAAKHLRRIQSLVFVEVSAWETTARANTVEQLEASERQDLYRYFMAEPAMDGEREEQLKLQSGTLLDAANVARSGVAFQERIEWGVLEKQLRGKLTKLLAEFLEWRKMQLQLQQQQAEANADGAPLGSDECGSPSGSIRCQTSFFGGVGFEPGSNESSRPPSQADGQQQATRGKPQRRKSSVAASAALRELIEKTDAFFLIEKEARAFVELDERATRKWLSQVIFNDPYYEYVMRAGETFEEPSKLTVWRRRFCINYVEEYQHRLAIEKEALSFLHEKLQCRSPFMAAPIREYWRTMTAREYVNAHFVYLDQELRLEEFAERKRLSEELIVGAKAAQTLSFSQLAVQEPKARREMAKHWRMQVCIIVAMWHPTMRNIREESLHKIRQRYFIYLCKRTGGVKPGMSLRHRVLADSKGATKSRALQTLFFRKWVNFNIRRKQIVAVSTMERTIYSYLMCRTLQNWAVIQHKTMNRRTQTSEVNRHSTSRARELATRYYTTWNEKSRDRVAGLMSGRSKLAFLRHMLAKWRRALRWVRRRRKYRQNVLKLTRRSALWRQARTLAMWRDYMDYTSKIRSHYWEVQDMFALAQRRLLQRFYFNFTTFLKRRHRFYRSLRLLGLTKARTIVDKLRRWIQYEKSSTSNRFIAGIKDRARMQFLVPIFREWQKYSQRHKLAKCVMLWEKICVYTKVRFTIKWMMWRKRIQYRHRLMESNQYDFFIRRNSYRYFLMRFSGWVRAHLFLKKRRLALEKITHQNMYLMHGRRYWDGWMFAKTYGKWGTKVPVVT
jgi:hypothetical protein